MDLGLKGLRALVSGGTKGIGRAIALELAIGGAAVLLHTHRRVAVAQELCDTLIRQGTEAQVVQADLADLVGLLRCPQVQVDLADHRRRRQMVPKGQVGAEGHLHHRRLGLRVGEALRRSPAQGPLAALPLNRKTLPAVAQMAAVAAAAAPQGAPPSKTLVVGVDP